MFENLAARIDALFAPKPPKPPWPSHADFHEAGHAVAAAMRGGDALRDAEHSHTGHGLVSYEGNQDDVPFIAYAGCWAEARGRNGGREIETYYVKGALQAAEHDRFLVLQGHATDQLHLLREDPKEWALWNHELARVWPSVVAIASVIHRGERVTPEMVKEALDGSRIVRFTG